MHCCFVLGWGFSLPLRITAKNERRERAFNNGERWTGDGQMGFSWMPLSDHPIPMENESLYIDL